MSINPEKSLLSFPMTIRESGRHGESWKFDSVLVDSPAERMRRVRMKKRYEERLRMILCLAMGWKIWSFAGRA